jgi:CNT family concentrative nucleoside transporter
MNEPGLRMLSACGLLAMIALAWAFSVDRRRMPWRIILWGLGIQLCLALLLLKTVVGRIFFAAVNNAVAGIVAYSDVGARFVFGPLFEGGFSIVAHVLPIIIFLGSLFSVLHHLGVVQRVVDVVALGLSRTLGTSGAESVAAVANVFVGMVEAPLLVRPYIERMTRSELFTVMTTGMATVAGSVLVAYVRLLGGEFGGHLVIASFLSAPAGVLIAKVMVPETELPATRAGSQVRVQRDATNVIEAASLGAMSGLRLAGYVGAMLIAFVAGIALINGALGAVAGWLGQENWTLQQGLGVLFAPLAWLMGIPWSEASTVGSLLGVKTVLNEFLAYAELAPLIEQGDLSGRSAVIASYALCGFANFGSLAILLGGIGGIAPSRRGDVARFGLRSILAGTLATLMTGCVAGIFL